MKKKDPSLREEPQNTTQKDVQYRLDLNDYIENTICNNVEKFMNFSKYVPRQTLSRFLARYEMFKKVLDVQGSIIECGVYQGGGLMSFAQLSSILEPVNTQRKIIGFDTFAGFTKISTMDKKGKSVHLEKGGFSSNSYDDLTQGIKVYDANRFLSQVPKVSLVKGDITKTVPKFIKDNPQTVVSLLYMDVDLFEPTKVAIEQFVPRMPKGAILAFDELNANTFPGETLAVLKTVGIKNLRIQRFPFDSYTSYCVIE